MCAVARRHGLPPQQLFTWRRLARNEAPARPAPAFVPAVIDLASTESPEVPGPLRRRRRRSKVSGIELEIDGVEVRVGPEAKPRTIAAVIRALKAGS